MPKMSMKKPQLGFLGFGLTGYIALGALAIILGISAYAYIQTSRLETVKQEYEGFKTQVKTLGEAAKLKAEAENKLNKERKEKADVELKKLRLANADLNKRLRDSTGRGSMSGNEASTRIPEGSCVSGGVVNESVSRFTERIESIAGRTAELIIEGQSALDSLNNAKNWAQNN